MQAPAATKPNRPAVTEAKPRIDWTTELPAFRVQQDTRMKKSIENDQCLVEDKRKNEDLAKVCNAFLAVYCQTHKKERKPEHIAFRLVPVGERPFLEADLLTLTSGMGGISDFVTAVEKLVPNLLLEETAEEKDFLKDQDIDDYVLHSGDFEEYDDAFISAWNRLADSYLCCPHIYDVSANGSILYVGSSEDIADRWTHHSHSIAIARHAVATGIPLTNVVLKYYSVQVSYDQSAWIPVDALGKHATALYLFAESLWINAHRPVINKNSVGDGIDIPKWVMKLATLTCATIKLDEGKSIVFECGGGAAHHGSAKKLYKLGRP